MATVDRRGGDVEATVAAAFTGDTASCLIAVAGAIRPGVHHFERGRTTRRFRAPVEATAIGRCTVTATVTGYG